MFKRKSQTWQNINRGDHMSKPNRSKGESNDSWYQRRDSYRLAVIEKQIAELQKGVKK